MEKNQVVDTGNQDLRGLTYCRRLADVLLQSAIRPSPAAAFGSILLAMIQIGVTCHVVTPTFVAGLADSALMTDRMDFDGLVTVVANRLKLSGGQGLNVTYTGDSVAMEAIDDQMQIGTELTTRLSREVNFWFVASHGQTLWETVTVLDQLPDGYRGVVIICVGPRRMMDELGKLQSLVESPRLALYSPSFDRELRISGLMAPKRTGVYFIDFGRFFVARRSILFRLLREPWQANIHHYSENYPGWTETDWQLGLPQANARLAPDRLESMVDLLQRQVERLQKKQVTVVLLEKPCHPRLLAAYGQPYRDYRDAVEAIAKRVNVDYWRLDSEANIEARDFHDWAHMGNRDARKRFQDVLTTRLAELLARVN